MKAHSFLSQALTHSNNAHIYIYKQISIRIHSYTNLYVSIYTDNKGTVVN